MKLSTLKSADAVAFVFYPFVVVVVVVVIVVVGGSIVIGLSRDAIPLSADRRHPCQIWYPPAVGS